MRPKRRRGSRESVKEHSKRQREKRKKSLHELERIAKFLSKEHEKYLISSEQMFELMKTKRSTFEYNLNLCLDYLFGAGYSNVDSSNRLEIAIVEDVEVRFPSIPIKLPNNDYKEDGDEVIVLKGIDQFTAFASRMDSFFYAIARLGENVVSRLNMKACIDTDYHLVEENRSQSKFKIESLNGTLAGGEIEIELNGGVNASFNDELQVLRMEIIFDVYQYHCILQKSFGGTLIKKAYGHEIQTFLREERAAIDQGLRSFATSGNIAQITTSGSSSSSALDFKLFITSISKSSALCGCNFAAKEMLTSSNLIDNVSLKISGDNGIANKKLSKWHVQSKLHKLIIEDRGGNASYIGNRRDRQFFMQAIPYACAPTPTDQNDVVTHIVHPVWQCKMYTRPLYYVFIEQFICRSINKYTSSLQISNEKNLTNKELLKDHKRDTCKYKTLYYLLSKLNDISEHEEDNHSFLESFLRWVKSIERRLTNVDEDGVLVGNNALSDVASVSTKSTKSTSTLPSLWYSDIDVFGGADYNTASLPGLDMNEPLSMTDDTRSNSVQELNSKSSDTSQANFTKEDFKMALLLLKDLNTFFMQIRNSEVSILLIESLVMAPTEEQTQIEQFIWLCWSKHPSRYIQKLMKLSSVLLYQKKFEDACEVLNAVIKIDPKYTEAYNKRATVNFGLRNAHKCFADIDWVLTMQPYHYGALYAKALMFMKLNSYQAALYTFERAARINPLLTTGSLGKNVRACKAALHAQMAQSGGQATTNEHAVSMASGVAQQAHDDYYSMYHVQEVANAVDSYSSRDTPVFAHVEDNSQEADV